MKAKKNVEQEFRISQAEFDRMMRSALQDQPQPKKQKPRPKKKPAKK